MCEPSELESCPKITENVVVETFSNRGEESQARLMTYDVVTRMDAGSLHTHPCTPMSLHATQVARDCYMDHFVRIDATPSVYHLTIG
jgi:hypothetical protein